MNHVLNRFAGGLLWLTLLVGLSGSGWAQLITTVAGTDTPDLSGDGRAATAAQLYNPSGVAVDGAGNLFIADQNGGLIRRVEFGTGIITTVAGTHTDTLGYSGDGGAATAAQLNFPFGVAVDGAGNLFISEPDSHRIRRVEFSTGIITTVAGTGTAGFSGDGGAATQAGLSSPHGVAVDGAGNLFIADQVNHRIRRVAASTGLITTVAGTDTAGFSGDGGAATEAQLNFPIGVAVDGAGNLFIADQGNHRIRRVAASTGLITTVAGTHTHTPGFSGDGGVATQARLGDPAGVAVDGAGNLFIADQVNHRIRRVAASTGLITTVAGTHTHTDTLGYSGDGGAATAAGLSVPTGVAVDGAGNLFIADLGNSRIRRVEFSTGLITTVAGTDTPSLNGDEGAATAARLSYPAGVAVDGAGNLFIADQDNNCIRRVAASTGLITTVAGKGTQEFSGDGGAATAAGLYHPTGVAVDGAGNLFIADQYNHRIRRVAASTGLITTVAGTDTDRIGGDGGAATAAGLYRPTGVAVDGAGNLFIADQFTHRIQRVEFSTGIITTVAGTGMDSFSGDGGAATQAGLNFPTGVAVDGAGNLFIADLGNSRIRRVAAATGLITTVAGTDTWGYSGDGGTATAARLFVPTGVAVDGAGNLFIADQYNHRIRRVAAATGLITTVAGTDTLGFSGDGGAATEAGLYRPAGVAVDGAGNLFIADQDNHRIRRVAAYSGPFALTGVTTISCQTVSVGERRLTFTPQYSGLTGQPITFQVLNELEPTTQPGPYTLRVYTDNPTINLRATQPGTAGEASFVYNWLGACNADGRRATAEAGSGLRVAVLGNPVGGKTVEVEISGVGGQSVAVTLRNLQGRLLNQQTIERASTTNRVGVPVETGQGMLLLEVSTATERQQIKLLRP